MTAEEKRLTEWLMQICDVAVDYDGCRDAADLVELIDELREMAADALAGDAPTYIDYEGNVVGRKFEDD